MSKLICSQAIQGAIAGVARAKAKLAETIAAHSLPALMHIKECVNQAFETPLSAGLAFERQAFFSAMGLADRAEGMAAFLEKRPPRFTDS